MNSLLKNFFIISLFWSIYIEAEIISSEITNLESNVLLLSTFGFLKGGYFEMNISLTLASVTPELGFRFDKSKSGGRADYMDLYWQCPLRMISDQGLKQTDLDVSRAVILFPNNTKKSPQVQFQIYEHKFAELEFFPNRTFHDEFNETVKNSDPKSNITKKREEKGFVQVKTLPVDVSADGGKITFSSSLFFQVDCKEQEGLYELYLHNCGNTKIIAGKIDITEKNRQSYLSAGEIALPTLYCVMAIVAFFTSLVWVVVLWNNRSKVFAIHYLMATFMLIKAISITFHSIDYYFIGRDGKQEAWAVIFYIVHLLKGILLFLCLLLIGTGWAFIKYVLSDREKKLFMIVIPLQVVANIAYMIQGEEQGVMTYNAITWTEVMFLIDILCFGIILISVVWSVRHLQEAAATDGKAAISLTKLKLFQHFYVMIICYLYFRRVLVYLLQITLPFHYTWIHHLFYEMVSLIFFVITGYKFRPGCDNPYLSIPQYDEDDVESHALTESGLTETVSKVNQYEKNIVSSDEDGEEVVLLQRNKTTMI